MKKRIILCIHGFKTGPYHDFDFFRNFCQNRKDLYDGEIELVELYDLNNKKSLSCKKWGAVALEVAKKYQEQDYEIYLIGYSMGCNIAGYVASKIKIAKLILIAPSFHFLGSKMLTYNAKLLFKMIKLKIKYRKRLSRFKKASKKMVPFKLMINVLSSIVKYKKYIKKTSAESLIILGLQDNYVPMRSANYAFRKIKTTNKQLWFIDHINHLFIFSKDEAPVVFLKILDFINGEIIVKSY